MKITYKHCLLILLLGNVLFTHAQTTLKGVVKDSLGVNIPMINVTVMPLDSNKIIAYCYSNDAGKYELEIKKTGKFILSATGMGYSSNQIIIETETSSAPLILFNDIVLQEKAFALDEVILNADQPIIVKKDTISIKVNSFTNGSEDVVEDILKKLPGIEVTKDGTIMVQGKSVEKVMVEGDDLFEKGYKLLTKNLHAGVIDRVEILEHFSDNALLKNIEDSDKVALNLTLKEDKKNTLFGNASLGYGTDQFYETKLNLISFNKKAKYYFFGNLNNIGSDAVGDIYQILYPDIFTSQTYIGDDVTGQNLINLNGSKPDLKESRLKFNNAELASLNGIYNPTAKLKLKGLVFFASDELGLNSSGFEEFLLPPNNFSNSENYKQKKKSIAISGKWDLIYKLNKNTQIEYIGRYNNGTFNDKSLLIFNEETINERLNYKTEFTDHRITYTHRINDAQAVQVTGRYIYDDKPQNYHVDTFLYGGLFPDLENILLSRQENQNTVNFIGIEGSYLVNKGNSSSSIKAGIVTERNSLQTNLSFEDDTQSSDNIGILYNNDFISSLRDLYIKTKYKYTFKKFSLRTSLNLHQFNSQITSFGIDKKESLITIIPSVGLSWQINKKNRILTSYKYSTRNIPFDQLYDGYALTNYRSFERGLGNFSQLKGSFFLASYILGNWSDSFLINTSLIYNKDHDYLGRNSQIEANYTLTNPIILKDREFYSLNFTGDKLIEELSSNVKLNASMSKNTIQNIINSSQLRTINSNSYTYGGELRSVFLGSFNFHLGTKWVTSRIKSSIENSNTNNTTFLDLNFDLTDNLSFQVKNESYYFGSLANNKTTYFTDIDAQYNIKGSKIKLKFLINNLFNNTTFSNFNISDVGSYGNSFQLLPRYFLLKMDYRF